jgi:hypothetical protein
MKHFITTLLIAIPFFASSQIIWDGPDITFTKLNGAAFWEEGGYDKITDNVWITRDDMHGEPFFNFHNEDLFLPIGMQELLQNPCSPSNTKWAAGTTADINGLEFVCFESLLPIDDIFGIDDTTNLFAGNPLELVLHIIDANIYIDLILTYYNPYSGNFGNFGNFGENTGGFSYTRSTPPCDTTITTDMQIHCNSYTWIDGNTYNSNNNSATFNAGPAITGCDSIVRLDLIIKNSTTSTTDISACDNYDWNGTNYTESGVYTHTTTNSVGCDSIVILDLIIKNSTTSTTDISACDNYDWNGTNYTESGVYTYTTTNSVGCDSTATLNLTINPNPDELSVNQRWSTTFQTGESFAYQWYLNGEEMEGETSDYCNFTQGGTYVVEAIDSLGCKTMSEGFVVGSVERNFTSEIDFMLYPNPTNQLLNIELQEELGTEYMIVVSDLTGRALVNFDDSKNNTLRPFIDLNNLAKGSYQITVKYSNSIAISKTVIKN